jgi:adenylate kinase
VCDECGASLTQRGDDTEAVVRRRLRAYRDQTEPVMAYYRQRDRLRVVEVDGGQEAQAVGAAVGDALENAGV